MTSTVEDAQTIVGSCKVVLKDEKNFQKLFDCMKVFSPQGHEVKV